jgi:hypothetical protein
LTAGVKLLRRWPLILLIVVVCVVLLLLDAVSGELTSSRRFPLLKVSLGHRYYRGPFAVYHRNNADGELGTHPIAFFPRRFEILGDGFARDATHVWCDGESVPLDPATFQVLADRFVRDRNNVWRGCRPQLRMSADGKGGAFDMPSLQALGCNLLRDRTGVYLAGKSTLSNGPRVIEFANPVFVADLPSFHVVDAANCQYADKLHGYAVAKAAAVPPQSRAEP